LYLSRRAVRRPRTPPANLRGTVPFRFQGAGRGISPMFRGGDSREPRRGLELAPDPLAAMRRTARALADTPEEADDLVQDTLVKVLARPREVEAAGPYLLQALRNTHVSTIRARGRRPRTSPLEPEDARLVASAALEPAAVVASREV